MTPHVRWNLRTGASPLGTKPGEATIVALDDDRITLRSTIPSAPGSRPEGELESGAKVRVKVASCRRDGEAFLIEGRLLDATRERRAEMQRLLAPPVDPGAP
jgi:hypothetical protein